MSKSLNTVIATLMLAVAGQTLAASSIDLAVRGSITPSACTPNLSAGTVEVGKISAQDLNQETQTKLPPASLELGIDCQAATLFAVKATDNRADSAIHSHFGIGKTAANQNIGGYAMFLSEAIADAVPVTVIATSPDASYWWSLSDDPWWTDIIVSVSTPSTGAPWAPIPARNTRIALSVNPFIHPAKNVTITEDTVIDGSVTLEVVYL